MDRMCYRCVYAARISTARLWSPMLGPATLTCVNHPDTPGQMREVMTNGTCRNFRARRRPPVWTTPPEPPGDDVRHIALTRGYFATVDAADYEWLSQYKWTALVTGSKVYAIRAHQGKTILMHREIMQPPDGFVVDHIDGNSTNNRRQNLRTCTRCQNLYNSRPRCSRSQYKGVRYDKRTGRWVAEITHRGRKYYLGSFEDEIDAAKAYDRKARELFGQYAHLNFPEELEPRTTDS